MVPGWAGADPSVEPLPAASIPPGGQGWVRRGLGSPSLFTGWPGSASGLTAALV